MVVAGDVGGELCMERNQKIALRAMDGQGGDGQGVAVSERASSQPLSRL